jgi:hypothetical protein
MRCLVVAFACLPILFGSCQPRWHGHESAYTIYPHGQRIDERVFYFCCQRVRRRHEQEGDGT